MICYPICKINLGLRILRKRPDGFHDIETLFYPIPLHDILEIVPSSDAHNHLSLYGDAISGNSEDNLVMRAVRLFQEYTHSPRVHIHLYKHIPMGAGLGGGSSDAAYTLTALNSLFHTGLDVSQLESMAASLGSDCAFFIRSIPAIGSGRGECLEPIPISLKSYTLLVLNPGIHVGTAEAYAGVNPRLPENDIKTSVNAPIQTWKNSLFNDFETSVFAKYPLIATLKSELYQAGAVYASMSGSGSSVFGIFENASDCNLLPDAVKKYIRLQITL